MKPWILHDGFIITSMYLSYTKFLSLSSKVIMGDPYPYPTLSPDGFSVTAFNFIWHCSCLITFPYCLQIGVQHARNQAVSEAVCFDTCHPEHQHHRWVRCHLYNMASYGSMLMIRAAYQPVPTVLLLHHPWLSPASPHVCVGEEAPG